MHTIANPRELAGIDLNLHDVIGLARLAGRPGLVGSSIVASADTKVTRPSIGGVVRGL